MLQKLKGVFNYFYQVLLQNEAAIVQFLDGAVLHELEEKGKFKLNFAVEVKNHCGTELSNIKSSFSVNVSQHENIVQQPTVLDFESVCHDELKLAFCDKLRTLLVVSTRHLESADGLILFKCPLV